MQDFDLSLDLLLLDGFQYLDDALRVVDNIDAFKYLLLSGDRYSNHGVRRIPSLLVAQQQQTAVYPWQEPKKNGLTNNNTVTLTTYFAVFSASDLSNDLVLFLVAPVYCKSLIIPVISWSVHIHVRVDSVFGNGKEGIYIDSEIIIQLTVWIRITTTKKQKGADRPNDNGIRI